MAEGLFNFNYQDPRLVRQAYTEQFQTPERELNRLDLLGQVVAMGGNAGASIGTGLGRLFGGKAPQEIENELMKGIFSQAAQATTDPVERMTLAAKGLYDAGMVGRAQQLEMEAAKLQTQLAQGKEASAKASKLNLEQQREEQLRSALAALPENATPEQYLSIVRKFGSPDKVMTSIQTSMDKEEQRKQRAQEFQLNLDARLQQAELAAQNRLEVAQMNNASREQIAALNRDNQRMLTELRLQGQRELAAMKSSLTQKGAPKDVAEADMDIVMIQDKSAKADEYLQMLKDNPKLMDRMSRAKGFVFSAAGIDSDLSRQQAEVEKYIKDQVNTILMAAKGTQTEGDANRAAAQVLSFLETGTTKGYVQALEGTKRLQDTTIRAKKSYIKLRGFESTTEAPRPPKSKGTGTPDDPIKLD